MLVYTGVRNNCRERKFNSRGLEYWSIDHCFCISQDTVQGYAFKVHLTAFNLMVELLMLVYFHPYPLIFTTELVIAALVFIATALQGLKPDISTW